jgi:hypothetical protein
LYAFSLQSDKRDYFSSPLFFKQKTRNQLVNANSDLYWSKVNENSRIRETRGKEENYCITGTK